MTIEMGDLVFDNECEPQYGVVFEIKNEGTEKAKAYWEYTEEDAYKAYKNKKSYEGNCSFTYTSSLDVIKKGKISNWRSMLNG